MPDSDHLLNEDHSISEIKWVKISQRIDTYLSLLCGMFITGQIPCQITAALEKELIRLIAFYGW